MSATIMPSGGQLLGEIATALDLHDSVDPAVRKLLGKSGQRFLAQGENVRHPCALILLLSWSLVGTPTCVCRSFEGIPELFTPIVFPARPPAWLARLCPLAIHAHALHWDRHARAHVTADGGLAASMVRFAALDTALKTPWFRHHFGLPAPDTEEVPAWANSARFGEPVRRIIQSLDLDSLEGLAHSLEVSVDAVKSWRYGTRRPKLRNLRALIARLPESKRAEAEAELSRHYALAALARRLQSRFGKAFVDDLANVFHTVVRCVMNGPLFEHITERTEALGAFMVPFSSWLLPKEVFLRVAEHHAPSWTSDIERAIESWRAAPEVDWTDAKSLELWLRQLHDPH